jgi:hypothetical protein
MTHDPTRDCEHGRLKGKCDVCDLQEEVVVQSLQCAHCHVTIETLNDKAMYLIAENERLNKALHWEQNRAERIGTHGPGCHTWGPAHYECLLRVNAELVEALQMGYADTMDYIQRNHLTGSENNRWLVLARAALEKATGGTK